MNSNKKAEGTVLAGQHAASLPESWVSVCGTELMQHLPTVCCLNNIFCCIMPCIRFVGKWTLTERFPLLKAGHVFMVSQVLASHISYMLVSVSWLGDKV